ncbi:MAG: SHOCT-like domain-containing protein [Bacillota bacterium]
MEDREGRLRILRLLAEGKITVEEAEAILGAGEKAAAVPRPAGKTAGEVVEGLAGLAARLASWPTEFGLKVAEEFREGRIPLFRWLADHFDAREVSVERTGRFSSTEPALDLSSAAGTILLRAVEGEVYRLLVRQRFGGDGPRIEADGDRLFVQGKGFFHLELELPRGLRYRLRLDVDAGRVEMAGLSLREAEVTTNVGSVILRDLAAGRLFVRTAVGTVAGLGITAEDLMVQTNCGGIELALAPAGSCRARLATDLGAIDLTLAAREELGYHLRAEANPGAIWYGPEFVTLEEGKAVGNRYLVAETPRLADRSIRVNLELKTNCGAIRVGGRS